jgi:hypothetical protein
MVSSTSIVRSGDGLSARFPAMQTTFLDINKTDIGQLDEISARKTREAKWVTRGGSPYSSSKNPIRRPSTGSVSHQGRARFASSPEVDAPTLAGEV